MEIHLSKSSDVPLRQQLAEQIVTLITTGEVRQGAQLPSVRALARQLKIHHNTVSEAYQDLVQRKWLTRSRGSRLVVGASASSTQPPGLDALINETIQRAKDMGFPLQALTEHVRERLLAQPPDHILVVEDEPGLRQLICMEVREQIAFTVSGCSLVDFESQPNLAVGAQIFSPQHVLDEIASAGALRLPPVAITYSARQEHVRLIGALRKASVVATVSISESALKTARGVFAPAIGRKHTFQERLVKPGAHVDLNGVDMAFCDSATILTPMKGRKVHYRLVASECLDNLAQSLGVARQRSTPGGLGGGGVGKQEG